MRYHFLTLWCPPRSPLFPYTTLFRSESTKVAIALAYVGSPEVHREPKRVQRSFVERQGTLGESKLVENLGRAHIRSEEHTSELQSRVDLVCRLLLEKKKR